MTRKKIGGGHTMVLQRQHMVEWLEVPAQFNIIVGKTTEERGNGFGAAQTKISGFGGMGEYVYHSCIKAFTDEGEEVPAKYMVKWDAYTCQSRWSSYFKIYKKVKARLDSQTGFGLTQEQIDDGKTLVEAVEDACPFFYRLDELFGTRQNVHPYSVLDSVAMAAPLDSSITPRSQVCLQDDHVPSSVVDECASPSSDFPISSLSFNLGQSTPGSATATPGPNPPSPTRGDTVACNTQNSDGASAGGEGVDVDRSLDTARDSFLSSSITAGSPSSQADAIFTPPGTGTATTPPSRSSDTPQRGSTNSERTSSSPAPSRGRSAQDVGSEKANQAKKRDFASTFREFSEKRLHAEARWRRAELEEAKANRLTDMEQKIQEREDRKAERELNFKKSQIAMRKDMFIRLLERGRTEDEALAVVDKVVPL